MSIDWKEHPLLQYESVQRWMNTKRLKDNYRLACLYSLTRYCAFRNMTPDQLITESIQAARAEEHTSRMKPKDMLNAWYMGITAQGTVRLYQGVVDLRRVTPFYVANGFTYEIGQSIPKYPARETKIRATRELTQKIINGTVKLHYRWLILLVAETGLRPATALALQYKHVKESLEKDETPLAIRIPGQLTKTGQPCWVFVLPDAKETLKFLLQQKRDMGEEITDETKLVNITETTFEFTIQRVTARLGINPPKGTREKRTLRAFTISSWRDLVQNTLEGVGVPQNRVSLLMGAQPPGRDAHYADPPKEVLAVEYMKAAAELIVYPQMMTVAKPNAIPKEEVKAALEDALTKVLNEKYAGRGFDLRQLREDFRKEMLSGLQD